ncbi:glycosyltransferase family 2 protein [Flavitalea sp.]|nr:glycosyltransferase family 2 protein [Flavitalea sp.]
MTFIEIIFFVGLVVIFYSYAGYGILLWVLVKIKFLVKKNKTYPNNNNYPRVTLLVAAYNEEQFILQKIENTLSLDYPSENLDIVFITDGSTDRTSEIVKLYPQITLLHQPARNGKIAAMHRAMGMVNTPYVIFSDANTILNKASIKNIIRHYQDPKVGGVAGEKKVIQSTNNNNAGGEGLYWKYESFLKKLDWKFYTVVGAAGELFSIRTSLYEYPGDDILLDDFIISLSICKKGYRIAYEAEAYASESESASIQEEQKRKIRISAGGFQSIYILRDLLNIFKYPVLSFQYISHRILRWTLCPIFLPVIFFFNILLVVNNESGFFYLVMLAQTFFYVGAFIGWILSKKGIKISLFYAPYYLVFINYSLYLGFIRFIKGNQTVLWEKAARSQIGA